MVHSILIPAFTGRRRWRMPRAAHFALLAASLFAPLTAQAQAAAKAARPDPLDPNAAVPTLSYESSLMQYRRLGDEKPVSWRDANDTVSRIGGWRVYAREAQQPDAASATAPAPAPATAAKPVDTPSAAKPTPMPGAHGHHKSP